VVEVVVDAHAHALASHFMLRVSRTTYHFFLPQ